MSFKIENNTKRKLIFRKQSLLQTKCQTQYGFSYFEINPYIQSNLLMDRLRSDSTYNNAHTATCTRLMSGNSWLRLSNGSIQSTFWKWPLPLKGYVNVITHTSLLFVLERKHAFSQNQGTKPPSNKWPEVKTEMCNQT